jgi:hypothetical protein
MATPKLNFFLIFSEIFSHKKREDISLKEQGNYCVKNQRSIYQSSIYRRACEGKKAMGLTAPLPAG